MVQKCVICLHVYSATQYRRGTAHLPLYGYAVLNFLFWQSATVLQGYSGTFLQCYCTSVLQCSTSTVVAIKQPTVWRGESTDVALLIAGAFFLYPPPGLLSMLSCSASSLAPAASPPRGHPGQRVDASVGGLFPPTYPGILRYVANDWSCSHPSMLHGGTRSHSNYLKITIFGPNY